MFEEMLKTRMKSAREAYQEEFEILAKQYETSMETIGDQKNMILSLETRLDS